MKTAIIIVLVVVLVLLGVGVWWVFFTRIRASRLGLPPPAFTSYIPFFGSSSSSASYGGPTPAPGGIRGWFDEQVRKFKQSRNTRTATGAYESSYNAGYGQSGTQARRFDEDAAWDSRVQDYNPYEEERELGLQPPAPGGAAGHWGAQRRADAGEGYQMNLPRTPGDGGLAAEESRGRTRSRSPGVNPFEDPDAGRRNPFGDDAEPAVGGASGNGLRGVNPKPIDTRPGGGGKGQGQKEDGDSPAERRSIFRENM